MRTKTLKEPSTLHYQWQEMDDRRSHKLQAWVDGWEIICPYALHWLDGQDLEDAVAVEQVTVNAAPGWYVKDDCGDVFPEPLESDLELVSPLQDFMWQEFVTKLATLREIGEPPANRLREFRLEAGRYRAEDCHDGILINPVLPANFDDTPNEERNPLDVDLWWGMPFILTRTLNQHLENYECYLDRCQRDKWEPSMTAVEWSARQADIRHQWMKRYPSGTAYDVRCLDGGAWDRSTWWGDADNLDDALAIAKAGPSWRRRT